MTTNRPRRTRDFELRPSKGWQMDRPTLATDCIESQVIPLYLGWGCTDFYILSWISNFVWSSFHTLFKARLRTNLTLLGATNVKEVGSIAGHGSWKSSHQSWRTLTVPRKRTIKINKASSICVGVFPILKMGDFFQCHVSWCTSKNVHPWVPCWMNAPKNIEIEGLHSWMMENTRQWPLLMITRGNRRFFVFFAHWSPYWSVISEWNHMKTEFKGLRLEE